MASQRRHDNTYAAAAGMVLQAMSSKLTNKFKTFCKTEMMDNFLYACIEYFTLFFELQKIRVS